MHEVLAEIYVSKKIFENCRANIIIYCPAAFHGYCRHDQTFRRESLNSQTNYVSAFI